MDESKFPVRIHEAYLTKSPYWQRNQNPTKATYIAYQKNGPQGLMLHSVGCNQPSAQVFVKNWNTPTFTAACVHAFTDATTGDVYRTMPSNYRAPHAGGEANNRYIGVEMCEPDCIKYKKNSASFTVTNLAKAQEMVRRTYESTAWFFALECMEWGFDPMKPGVIISHNEGYDMGIASNHSDPEHLWKGVGLDYSMDGFRRDVRDKMQKLTTVAGFSDVPAGVWYAEHLEWAKEQGITKGLVENEFGPYLKCNRAQAVTMLWRLKGSPKVKNRTLPFNDVDDDAYYAEAVCWAYANGVTEGMAKDAFEPNADCTRGQIVTMLWRTAGKPVDIFAHSPFDDIEQNAFYEEAAKWAYTQGITVGVADCKFAPAANCTRAEMVAFLHRFAEAA